MGEGLPGVRRSGLGVVSGAATPGHWDPCGPARPAWAWGLPPGKQPPLKRGPPLPPLVLKRRPEALTLPAEARPASSRSLAFLEEGSAARGTLATALQLEPAPSPGGCPLSSSRGPNRFQRPHVPVSVALARDAGEQPRRPTAPGRHRGPASWSPTLGGDFQSALGCLSPVPARAGGQRRARKCQLRGTVSSSEPHPGAFCFRVTWLHGRLGVVTLHPLKIRVLSVRKRQQRHWAQWPLPWLVLPSG